VIGRSGALRLLGHQFELVRHSAELGNERDSIFPHRSAAVDLTVALGDADIAGNLLAEATARDLYMISRSLGLNDPKRSLSAVKAAISPAGHDRERGLVNGVEDILIAERLVRTRWAPPFNRLHSHRDVAVPVMKMIGALCAPRRARLKIRPPGPAISRRGQAGRANGGSDFRKSGRTQTASYLCRWIAKDVRSRRAGPDHHRLSGGGLASVTAVTPIKHGEMRFRHRLGSARFGIVGREIPSGIAKV